MVYSLSKKCCCFCCRLFARDEKETGTASFVTGFQAWWKVSDHEARKEHLSCLENWKTLATGLKLGRTVDYIHETTMDMEEKTGGILFSIASWTSFCFLLSRIFLFMVIKRTSLRQTKAISWN